MSRFFVQNIQFENVDLDYVGSILLEIYYIDWVKIAVVLKVL